LITTDRPTITLTAKKRLNAPPHRVYDTIANYRTGHPRILPKEFSGLIVEQGGVGDGTVIRYEITVYGRTTTIRAEITEPEPGRVLMERNIEGNDACSTFLIEPGATASESIATIYTEMSVRHGLAGTIEGFLIRRVLTRLFEEELGLLEKVAGGLA
jgi:hypothetical protein